MQVVATQSPPPTQPTLREFQRHSSQVRPTTLILSVALMQALSHGHRQQAVQEIPILAISATLPKIQVFAQGLLEDSGLTNGLAQQRSEQKWPAVQPE